MNKYLIVLGLVCIVVVPLSVGAWYSGSYGYCRTLTMTAGGNSGGVATTTTAGFALVATSTIASLAATTSAGKIYETSTASGTTTPVDLVITNGTSCNASGSLVDFYFEKYVPTTGEFVLWAESSDISSTSAKTLLMYYGYPDNSATDVSNEEGVFGGLSEASVWNFHENPADVGAGGTLDSTSNNNDGTDQGMGSFNQVAGMVDGAYAFESGLAHYVSTANSFVNPQTFTIMAWFKTNSALGRKIIGFEDAQTGFGGASYDRHLYVDSSGNLRFGWYDGTTRMITSSGTLNDNGWHHGVGTFSSGLGELFVNGASQGTLSAGAAQSYTGYWRMGNFKLSGWTGGTDGSFEGTIDDVRVFSRKLHSMDVLTIYNNTRSSAIFWTFGAEETPPSAPSRRIRLFEGATIRVIGTTVKFYGN